MNRTLKRKNKNRKNKSGKNKTKRFFHRKKERKSRKHVKFLLKGGNINPPSFQPFNELDGKYYSLNSHNNDPLNSNTIISERNLPNMTQIKGGRRKRKMKGGTFIATSSLANNPFTNFGSVSGAITGSNLINGQTLGVSPDPIIQPSYYTYNEYRPPLA